MDMVLGAMFALGVMLGVFKVVGSVETQVANDTRATVTAGQLKQIADATQSYIQQNFAAVEAVATASSPAVITTAMLQAENDLPAAIQPINPYGQTWEVQVLQPTPGNLQALVLSLGGSTIPEDEAPSIATKAGQEGGFVPVQGETGLSNTVAQGAFGHWSVPLAGYTNPGSGHLAALVAFSNGSLVNDYLYRVAEPGDPALTTMETTLNMGGNDITAANNVAADSVTASGNVAAATATTTGAVTAGNGAALITNDPGEGGLEELTGSNGNVSALLNENGSLVSLVNNNSVLGFDIAPNGQFQTGSTITPGAVATQGVGCSPNGALAPSTNGTGQELNCQSGVWQPLGGSGIVNLNQTTSMSCTPGSIGILDATELATGTGVPDGFGIPIDNPTLAAIAQGDFDEQVFEDGTSGAFANTWFPFDCPGGIWTQTTSAQAGNTNNGGQ
jgi:hypothetical protein